MSVITEDRRGWRKKEKRLVCYRPVLVCFMLLFFAVSLPAQKKQDSLPQRDTLRIYKKIKKAASRYRFTTFLYHSVFVDPAPLQYEDKPLSDQQQKQDPNEPCTGRIIRKVNILVMDPFGYSVNDTTEPKVYGLQRLGNRVHITTRHRIIRNLLLFQPGDSLDLLKISESERLLRAAGYVNDARIYLYKDSCDVSDSVDVRVVVQDKWSLEAGASGSPEGGDVTINEFNIAGSGQHFRQYFRLNSDETYEVSGRHTIGNISNTYISSVLFYTLQRDMSQVGFSFDRPFFSSLTKWAGGVLASKTWNTYNYVEGAEREPRQTDLDYYNSDVWIGRSIHTDNKKLNNLVAAFRYERMFFEHRPGPRIDTARNYLDHALYLGNIGFSRSKYYKDQYIFRFGANEDIPEGLIVQFTYGLSEKEGRAPYYYLGGDVSRGKHIEHLGYWSTRLSYGIFFNRGMTNDATLRLKGLYFTDILRLGRWYFRQFAYFDHVAGLSKPGPERITLNTEDLYAFNSGSANGRMKATLKVEGVSYAPYNLVGFRFAPLLLIGLGSLGDSEGDLLRGRIYQAYAVGMLFRNESLLNSSVKVTFGFYPYQPGDHSFSTRFNPVTSFSVRFDTFSSPKPELIQYR